MPSLRRRAKRKSEGYNEWHVLQLQEGFDLWGAAGPLGAFGNDDEFDEPAARAAWEILREQIMADWIAQHPGQRPWAWWRFDAPERRRRIDGIQHPFDDRIRKKKFDEMEPHFWARRHANDLCFGVPRLTSTRDEATAKYESEAEYLRRLNLLTPAEHKELFE